MEKPLIGIIGGKGKMGALFSQFFKDQGCRVLISDRGTKRTNEQVAKEADIVIVSVPIDKTIEVIESIRELVRPDALLTDLTSIKVAPLKAMKKGKCQVAGMHPMFGDTNPIQGQRIIMCPGRGTKWYNWLKKSFKEQNVIIEEMKAKEHDRMMTVVQGLVHFADISFAHTLKNLKIKPSQLLRFASPQAELKMSFAARILAQDPTLYGNIQLENEATLKTLKKYQKSVDELLTVNEKKDLKKFTKYFKQSADYLSSFKSQALIETSWIIDQVIENRRKRKGRKKNAPKTVKTEKGMHVIATLGPQHTYSDTVTQKHLKKRGGEAQVIYCDSIREVFEMVKKKKAYEGIVPIENNLNGSVRETMDALCDHKVTILEELIQPIHHCLVRIRTKDALAKQAKNKAPLTICSHQQALQQCKKFCSKKSPHAELKAFPSTTAALKHLLKERDQRTHAIGSKAAATALNLEILKEKIEDNPQNKTKFIRIATEALKERSDGDKTTIVFTFAKDSPGSLASVLQEFAEHTINLLKLETRPSRKEIGNYYFLIDLEGSHNEAHVKKCFSYVKKKVKGFKCLGSYSTRALRA